jgi:hypothetical protein
VDIARVREGTRDARFVRHVQHSLDDLRAPTEPVDRLLDLVELVRAPCSNDDARGAGLRERDRRRAPDPAARARDEHAQALR